MTDNKTLVVVSMTSFPAAIGYAEQAVQYLLNGSVLPDKLVLYLTLSQFEGQEQLLDGVRQLADKSPIFEVRDYPTDIRSYRKLVPALHDFPEAIIVTVDDDTAYHSYAIYCVFTHNILMPYSLIALNALNSEHRTDNGRNTVGTTLCSNAFTVVFLIYKRAWQVCYIRPTL